MRTKWEILEAKRARLAAELRELDIHFAWMDSTPFKDGDGGCSYCGTPLPTEADFAKHYMVEDERFVNLGTCPERQG